MTVVFREVALPPAVKGRLLLHSMPGFQESLAESLAAIKAADITEVICLTPQREVESRSPEYARAIKNNAVGARLLQFPITDLSADSDPQTFVELAKDVGARLQGGESILVHCAFGIGRTGTVATLVLMALGVQMGEALDHVVEAGSRTESSVQLRLIRSLALEF